MLVVAAVGLVVNIISFRLLTAGAKESLNVKGAYLEVLSDLLGSIAVIAGAIVITTTGFRYIDAIIAAAIGLFILPRTWKLMRQALRIIMEVAPPGVDVDAASRDVAAVPGVVEVHDLHIWTVTSGMEAATAHIVIDDDADWHAVLDRTRQILAERYGVTPPPSSRNPPTMLSNPPVSDQPQASWAPRLMGLVGEGEPATEADQCAAGHGVDGAADAGTVEHSAAFGDEDAVGVQPAERE